MPERTSNRVLTPAFLILWFIPFILNGQEHVQAARFSRPPVIDGMIREEVWKESDPITRFVQREPYTGEPMSDRTEVYIGFDRHHLYIAFRCYTDPDHITAKEMARDVSLKYDDRIQIILDTYLDRRSGYWFQVGPRGSIGDAIVSENGAAFNKAWDGLWTGKAQIHDLGWDTELAIPFKTLGFREGSEQWGLKLIRNHMNTREVGYWPVANLNTHRFQVSDAGILEGLQDITQGVGLDVVPYGLTGFDYSRDPEEARGKLSGGLEAYYNITPNLKAAVTVNTDFAQTEVDDREINLTRFNLFYPEKRDFFLDGANYFNFGINGDRENEWNTRMIPFFSRRIGLDSLGNPIPVQYGGKITGQAGRWNIGAMYMKDQRASWTNSHFAVTRVTRNFGDQSQVGMITTYGNALADERNATTGMDVKLGTSTFMGDRNISLTLYGVKSFTHFDLPESDGPDRDLTFGAEFLYPNDLIHIRAGHLQIQEDFETGIGFVPRTGIREWYGSLMWGPRPRKWGVLQVLAGGGIDHISGFTGRMLTREWSVSPLKVLFLSGDELGWEITSSFEFLEKPFLIYGDHIIPEGSYGFRYHTLTLHTAQRRKIWFTMDYRTGRFYEGTRNEIRLKSGYKVAVPLFVGGELVRNHINLPDGGFTARVYRVNLNLLFSPDITLYTFIQYDSESDLMGWQSRFRWILQPGREIFLVWNSIASDPYNRFRMEEATARLKVKFTIRF